MKRMIRETTAAVILAACLGALSTAGAAIAQEVVRTPAVQTVAYRPWVRPYYGYRPYGYRVYRPYAYASPPYAYRSYYRPYYPPYYGYRAYRPGLYAW